MSCFATPPPPRGFGSSPVLLLGGTAEARELASSVVSSGWPVVSSLAGAVRHPRMPEGQVRVGGFGGIDGLVRYLREHHVGAVVDATHPFAKVISAHTVAACEATATPLLRLERPGWSQHPRAGSWYWAADHLSAGRTAAELGSRILLTTGRQSLPDFVEPFADCSVVARVVDPPEVELPPRWTLLHSRGPYARESETALLRAHHTQVLVTKDSGGRHTVAKLDAAADLGVAVVVVRRPGRPDSAAPVVRSPAAAVEWLGAQRRRF